jgi:hypothetical protein
MNDVFERSKNRSIWEWDLNEYSGHKWGEKGNGHIPEEPLVDLE